MNFKDILNSEIVNLKNCEDELIHIPGSIQPYGFLFGLKITDLTIDYCSSNTFEVLGLSYEQLLGKPIAIVLGDVQTNELRNYISNVDKTFAAPLQLKITYRFFNCSIHKDGNVLILEFEPEYPEQLKLADIYRQTKQLATYMQKAGTLQILCQNVADETRDVTGYDRVMIYRFDDLYNGQVYAESKVDNVESWLNLHYPHTDIPVQARALFMRNLIRIIPDVNYIPAPIYTIDDYPGKNLDLSLSLLRSSSPIHIQYLKNMGVVASLTISLIYQEKLWGLIACHHYSPKLVNNDVRMAAQLQGHFLSSQIGVRELSEEYEVAKKVNRALDDLLTDIFSVEGKSISNIIKQENLLQLTNASSVIVLLEDEIYANGSVPPAEDIRKLTNWLHIYSPPTGIDIINLPAVYPDARKWSAIVSGVIFHSLGSGPENCILWCRPEVVQEVHWAGNPKQPINNVENALSPRRSFEKWKEIKRWESFKWRKPELMAATNFANAFQKHVHMLFLAKETLKQRTLNDKLKEANGELENLYWIGSHDLKEPLRKIQMFASRIINQDHAVDINFIYNSVKRMNDSAKRMQLLVSDVLSYSRLNYIEDRLENISLNDLVNDLIEELAPDLEHLNATIERNNLPEVLGVFSFLQQLFVNLVRNSLKFSKTDMDPVVIINYVGDVELTNEEPGGKKFHKITITDNGIGFDNQFKETIFKVFTRLHNQGEYSGSGVGLALCRKIMKNHNGYISAEGMEGIGTTISLFFPMLKRQGLP